MAKLKNSPLALNIINVVSYVVGIFGFFGGLIFALINYTNNGPYTYDALLFSITSVVGYAFLSGLYHLVKAACIYIEKEEKEAV